MQIYFLTRFICNLDCINFYQPTMQRLKKPSTFTYCYMTFLMSHVTCINNIRGQFYKSLYSGLHKNSCNLVVYKLFSFFFCLFEQYLDKLKCLDLRNSKDLIQTPNLIGVPILARLYLSWCGNLVEIHPSVGQLCILIILELEHCHSLTNLPRMTTRMESLTTLSLCGCSKIRKIPEFEGILKSLSKLNLSETAIEELPSSIECLTALTLLDLRNCENLYYLPSNMSSLKSLEKLVLSGCLQLANLPENIWEINCQKELDLSRTGLRQPFERNFSALSSLFSQKLNLSRFSVLEGIRLNIGLVSSSSLKCLTLSWNKFVTLPATINQLSKLETLDLRQCDQLRELPELPSTVRYLSARGCYSLESSQAILKTSSSFRPRSLQGQHDESKGEVAFTILNRFLQVTLYISLSSWIYFIISNFLIIRQLAGERNLKFRCFHQTKKRQFSYKTLASCELFNRVSYHVFFWYRDSLVEKLNMKLIQKGKKIDPELNFS